MFMYRFCLFFWLINSLSASVHRDDQYYYSRYGVTDISSKIIDNRGNGIDALYGLRNMRTVLKGLYYRGGSNNYYHRTQARDNRNPMPHDGRANLCQEGFDTAIYLYPHNASGAPKTIKCQHQGKTFQTRYYNLLASSLEDRNKIIEMIYQKIINRGRPIYIHCWNGWHASGLLAALALRQFCDYSAELAVTYWDKNTDGVNKSPGYEKIRNIIRDFTPQDKWQVSNDLKARYCPSSNFQLD
jgi:hypothetical protein